MGQTASLCQDLTISDAGLDDLRAGEPIDPPSYGYSYSAFCERLAEQVFLPRLPCVTVIACRRAVAAVVARTR